MAIKEDEMIREVKLSDSGAIAEIYNYYVIQVAIYSLCKLLKVYAQMKAMSLIKNPSAVTA
jgi:hypothetical protein